MNKKRMARWLYSSMIKHIKTFIDAESDVLFHLEGTERTQDADDQDIIELRINGPKIDEVSKDVFRIFVEANCLIQSVMSSNIYRHIDLMGVINDALLNDIEVYKYGPESEDDDTFVGCLRLVQDARGRERVETTNFGQIDLSIKLLQATVEAHYEMFLI